jgi:hypothetical protein
MYDMRVERRDGMTCNEKMESIRTTGYKSKRSASPCNAHQSIHMLNRVYPKCRSRDRQSFAQRNRRSIVYIIIRIMPLAAYFYKRQRIT